MGTSVQTRSPRTTKQLDVDETGRSRTKQFYVANSDLLNLSNADLLKVASPDLLNLVSSGLIRQCSKFFFKAGESQPASSAKAARIRFQVVASSSGKTRVSAIVVMKLVSPSQRGSACRCR